MHQIRLFVMCNSQVVRKSLSVIFASENNFDVVGETLCCQESIREAQEVQPDALLINMEPRDEALMMIQLIREACPYTKIFFFIEKEATGNFLTGIAAEVDGCLSRTMLPRDLVKAVDLSSRTGILCLPAFLKRLIQRNEYGAPQQTANKERESDRTKAHLPLTPRELEIYKLVTSNYTNKEIGKKLFISQPTVKSHVSSILRKLALNNRTQLLFYEIENKYLSNTHGTNKELHTEAQGMM